MLLPTPALIQTVVSSLQSPSPDEQRPLAQLSFAFPRVTKLHGIRAQEDLESAVLQAKKDSSNSGNNHRKKKSSKKKVSAPTPEAIQSHIYQTMLHAGGEFSLDEIKTLMNDVYSAGQVRSNVYALKRAGRLSAAQRLGLLQKKQTYYKALP